MWLPWRQHLIPFYIWPLLAIPLRRLISQCPLKYVGNGFSRVAHLNEFPWKRRNCKGGSIAKNVFLDSLSVCAKF